VASGRVLGPDYDEQDVAALASEVLPKYLCFFANLAVDRLILAPQAAVGAMGVLGSAIVDGVAERLPSAVIQCFEPSAAGVRAAIERTSSASNTIEVEELASLPIKRPDNSFTHVVAVHPIIGRAERILLTRELFRVLVPGGQMLLTLPLRGSYPEIADMLREFALKHDSTEMGEAVEIGAQARPTPETLSEELDEAGFWDVDVDVELLSVPFDTGRDFAQHPLFRLIVAPEIAALLGLPEGEVTPALEYAKLAVQNYWSEGQFDLTVNIGCVNARKP
jgi:SAM-dependent methyltransferase